MSVVSSVMPGNDPEWCPRCKRVTLGENLVEPFGGWCPCGFTVPDCRKPGEYAGLLAKELGLPSNALSCHAPWAYSLMYLGKDVENRTSRTPGRAGGYHFPASVLGRIWIHASAWPASGPLKPGSVPHTNFLEAMGAALIIRGRIRFNEEGVPFEEGFAEEVARRFNDITQNAVNIRGHIIGSVEVVGYRTPDDPPTSTWYVPGSLAIMVRDPIPLQTPVPAKGALGWWTPSKDFYRQVEK